MLRRILGCTAIALLVAPAAAADDEDFLRPGWYVTAYGLGATELFRDVGGVSFEDWSPGAGALVGWRANDWVSLELQAEWVDGFEQQNFPGTGAATIPTDVVDLYMTSANAKLSLPFFPRVQPFLKYGIGAAVVKGRGQIEGIAESSNDSDSAFAFRGGAGVDVYATKNLAFTLGADYVVVDQDLKLDYIPVYLGATWRF